MFEVAFAIVDYACSEKYGNTEARNIVFEEYVRLLAKDSLDAQTTE